VGIEFWSDYISSLSRRILEIVEHDKEVFHAVFS
jgi:hypothetical protein